MLKPDWKKLADQSGCHEIACINPADIPQDWFQTALSAWQTGGNSGSLGYIDSKVDILQEPFRTRPWARSALVISFAPRPDKASPVLRLPPALEGHPAALVAPYAMNEDYHLTGRAILDALTRELSALAACELVMESCVDSKPVMEKQLARLAGLGVQGINSLIRNDALGCQLHLGVIFTSLGLESHLLHGTVTTDCSTCMKCRQICPNQVFGDGGFEVRKCRAWLASEYRHALTAEEQRLLGNVLFGCGLCTLMCPSVVPLQRPYAVDAESLLMIPTAALRDKVAGTILERTGATLLKRNAAAALAQQLPREAWLARLPRYLDCSNSPVVRETMVNA